MTARIGYLAALTGEPRSTSGHARPTSGEGRSSSGGGRSASGGGRPTSGEGRSPASSGRSTANEEPSSVGGAGSTVGPGRSSAGGRPATLRPPRRVFGAADFSHAEPGFLDSPGAMDAPSFTGSPSITSAPGLPEELTAGPDAIGALSADAPAGHATPGLPRQPERAPRPELRPGRTAFGPAPKSPNSPAPEPEPRGAAGGRESGGAAGGRESGDASKRDAEDIARQFVPARSEANVRARATSAGTSDARHTVSGQHPVSADSKRVDISAHPDVGKYPLSPTRGAAGHQSALGSAGTESGSASQGPVRRAPGEPWRIPRLKQPAGDGAVAPAVSPLAVTAPMSDQAATAAPGTAHSAAQPSPQDRATGPQPARHGTGSASAPPHAAAASVTGLQSSVTPPGASPAHRVTGQGQGGNASGLSGGQSSSVPLSDARMAAQPQVPGTQQPGTAGLSSLLPTGVRHPNAPLASASNSGSPLTDALLPGGLAGAVAEAVAPSAARPSAAAGLSASPLSAARPSATQPFASPLSAARPSATPPSAGPLPAAPQSAAHPSAASLPVAPLVGSAESSPRYPAADRAPAQLTPTVSPASRPQGSRAEAPPPSAPTLTIGTIEVTLLPPPQAPAPSRPARRAPPQRLSRGLGRRFGQGQA